MRVNSVFEARLHNLDSHGLGRRITSPTMEYFIIFCHPIEGFDVIENYNVGD